MDYDGRIKTYNQGDDAATARQYYTEDITITMPLGALSGRDQVVGFLARGHTRIPEELRPRIVVRSKDHVLAEPDIVLRDDDARMVEGWFLADELNLAKQLGLGLDGTRRTSRFLR